MYVEQIYTGCLSQATYYIESEGEAAIIDPLRDYQPYIDMAEKRGAKIKYVFETHFHADFVSGHIDLAKATGATIVYGPTAQTEYEIYVAKDGEKFKLGKVEFEVLHTPGHTPESSCFLLSDEKGKHHSLYSGDTLFIGDVGRPDLLDGVMTKEELAGMMYDSLHNKIMPLEDDIIVYPAHGAGSACGKNLSDERFQTLGNQKENNYALQDMSKEEFIKVLTDGIAPPPQYFFKDAKINKTGYPKIEDVVGLGTKGLSAAEFEKERANGTLVLDTRTPDEFEMGFVPGAMNIGLNGQFAVWAGTLLDVHKPLILVTAPGTEEEAAVRLARVGFDNILGYLKGGIEAWKKAGKPIDMVISIDTEELDLDAKHGPKTEILDVRKQGEFDELHLEGAEHLTLQDIPAKVNTLDKDKEYLVHCAGGYRSMIAASILKAHGFMSIKNVYGGFGRIKEETTLKLVPTKKAKVK